MLIVVGTLVVAVFRPPKSTAEGAAIRGPAILPDTVKRFVDATKVPPVVAILNTLLRAPVIGCSVTASPR
jgi:hypothetical protein